MAKDIPAGQGFMTNPVMSSGHSMVATVFSLRVSVKPRWIVLIRSWTIRRVRGQSSTAIRRSFARENRCPGLARRNSRGTLKTWYSASSTSDRWCSSASFPSSRGSFGRARRGSRIQAKSVALPSSQISANSGDCAGQHVGELRPIPCLLFVLRQLSCIELRTKVRNTAFREIRDGGDGQL